jgi:Domain of unknown function (DUF5110)
MLAQQGTKSAVHMLAHKRTCVQILLGRPCRGKARAGAAQHSCPAEGPFHSGGSPRLRRKASGELYLDDGETFAFEQGQYIATKITDNSGVL